MPPLVMARLASWKFWRGELAWLLLSPAGMVSLLGFLVWTGIFLGLVRVGMPIWALLLVGMAREVGRQVHMAAIVRPSRRAQGYAVPSTRSVRPYWLVVGDLEAASAARAPDVYAVRYSLRPLSDSEAAELARHRAELAQDEGSEE